MLLDKLEAFDACLAIEIVAFINKTGKVSQVIIVLSHYTQCHHRFHLMNCKVCAKGTVALPCLLHHLMTSYVSYILVN